MTATLIAFALAFVLCACGMAPAGNGPGRDARAPGPAACTTTVVAGESMLAQAVAAAGPGDVVCLSGTFDERLLLQRGGTAAAPLTIRSLDLAEPAVLQPAGDVPEGDQGVVELRDVAHVRIEGLAITGWTTDRLGHSPAGIIVSSSGPAAVEDVELLGNRIHDLGHTHPAAFTGAELAGCEGSISECAGELASQVQAFGIAVKGRASSPISGLRVVGNTLEDLTLGGSEALAINGNIDGFEVTDNVVHDIDNIAVDAIGFEDLDSYPLDVPIADKVARNGLIARNRVWNVSSDGNPAYGLYGEDGRADGFDRSAVGVYVDGGRDVIVEGNVVVRADIGIEVAAEFDFGATSHTTVRSNLIGLTDFAGIAIGGYAEENDDSGLPADEGYNGEGDAIGIQVVGNTVHTEGGGSALVVQHRVRDSVVAGNIFAAADGLSMEGVSGDAFDGIERTANLEMVAGAEGDNPDGVFITADLPSSEVLLAGGDALRIFLHLAPDSRAIDAGVAVTDLGTVLNLGNADIDGDPRRAGTVDAGADEVLQGIQSGRIAGSNRFATAAAIAAADHPAGADVVVLARADDFADAVASAPVAFGMGAPVLVSDTDALNAETAEAIAALDPTAVLIFGGPAALSDRVEATLAAAHEVERIAGPNRYATAAEAAGYLGAHGGIGVDDQGRRVAMVAEAGDPRGPLVAGVPAAVGGFPVLLADADRLPEETRAALVGNGIAVVELIGNTTQISEGVQDAIEDLGIEVRRVEGPTQLGTVAAVARMGARRGLLTGQGAVLGRGDNVVDTLTAGPHAASRGVPILLTEDPSTMGEAARGWLEDPTSPSQGIIEAIGGTAALTDMLLQDAIDAASGSAGSVPRA